MIKILRFLSAGLLIFGQIKAQSLPNKKINFDRNWRFQPGGFLGAEKTNLNDSGWRKVDLPHDFSIEDLPGKHTPFAANAISQVNGGFTGQGTAWYRKDFNIPLAYKDKHIILQFDGVYMNSDVYVNGQHLGNHPYGYTGFNYDITQQLKFGKKNIVAVEVKNEGQNSRWYSGSGIYRHVWLKIEEPVHIVHNGNFITTPRVDLSSAKVNMKTALINEGSEKVSLKIITRYLGPDGTENTQAESNLSLSAGEKKEINKDTEIKNPQLWSCESPALYKALTEVYKDGKLVDSEEILFGIRKITFDATNGFQLNGKKLKLKGGCVHHDNGPLGSSAYDRAEERKVEILKANGFNAIRCSHNPPSEAFLNACDRLGMLVIDESFDMWYMAKNPYDYHLYFKDWWQKDMESMITRDRNHPSIIMWSIGNEIPEKSKPIGIETANMLAQYIKSLDTTRPVTAAVNSLNPDKDPFFAALDVAGYNYAIGGGYNHPLSLYKEDHLRLPERIMFGSESYPLEAFDNWMAVQDDPYMIGDFVWAAWDYIGEASIGWLGYPQNNNFYPWSLAFCGDIDICGWKRPQSFYRDVLWKDNQLSVFVKPPQVSFKENPDKESWSKWNWADVVPEWNWKGNENKPMEVCVYSSCEKAELFLNGRSLGIKSTNKANKFIAYWKVPYQAGELKAVGYNGGKPVQTSALRTAGPALKIKLTADRVHLKADSEDLSYITVEITDVNGALNTLATNLVKFKVTGDAKIIGVGNSNPVSLESFQMPQRKAWKGKCLVIVKAGAKSKITLSASSSGLNGSEIYLESK